MKENWTYKKLGEVCSKITDGSHNPPKGVPNSNFIMISSQNVYNDHIEIKDVRYLSEDDFNREDKRTKVRANDVLLTIVGTVGRCAVVSEEIGSITLQRSVAVLTPKPFVNSRYLMYCCIGHNSTLNTNAHGIAQKGIYLKQLSELKIPIPSIETQSKIVNELDLLQSIIDKQKTQLKELDNLAQAVFYDMFGTTIDEKGWVIKKLGEVGTFQRGGGFLKSDFIEEGFPCIHYGQIHTKFGAFIISHLTSISKDLAMTKSKIAHKGDVIIAITSEDVEGSCKCTAWLGDYDVAVGAHAAIYSHKLNPIYVSYYFRSAYFNQAKVKYAHGFKVVEIKPNDLATISISIPPLFLQQSFADKIKAIEKQKATISKSIEETQKLFDYTMDKYFG